METDKQLVELIDVKALDVLNGQQQNSFKYQSVTLFLRGRFNFLRSAFDLNSIFCDQNNMATASYEYIPNETKHSLYIKTNVALRKQESSPKNNNKKKTILLYVIRLALTSF